uniref:Uncharacterized protein n=1 Tax=Ditylenchus dipsaci TaxID=166011 RepID=A0A915DQ20_9BILA
MSEEIEKKIQSMEQKQLEHEKQLGEHNNRIKKAEIIQKREETNKNSRSIVITPFDGDRKNYAKYKSSIVDFITKCFNDLLGADPPNVESVVVWKDRPSATQRSENLAAVHGGSAHESQEKGPGARRCLFERLSNKRKVGVGEQQKGTK